jgi:gamma-glutamyltranspeptidase / glutathione hydrolase
MKGAIAAGHPVTARAGATALENGGNAVDACVAAALASWVAESPLTGPGAGGFLLVHRARDRSDHLLDFFVVAAGRGLHADPGTEMNDVEVPFDARTIQIFRIGVASVAVPGAVAGLGEAHRRYGCLPWKELFGPAIAAARGGVRLSSEQAFLHAILDVALRATPEGCAVYGADRPLAAGETLRMPQLADTLELLAKLGADAFYRGELARTISRFVLGRGGRLTEQDLATYRVVRRRPVRAAFRGHELVTNPPPSAGGILIALALRIVDELGSAGAAGSSAALALVAETMREATRARGGSFASALHRGGLAERLLSDGSVGNAARRVRSGLGEPVPEPAGMRGTTHISVVDGAGNAASLSASTGCGSGVVVPGTGIHLNNMLGEADLNPGDRGAAPGRRLTSMMAPTIALAGGDARLVVGSAGSIRLRGAIFQLVLNVIAHGMKLEEAVSAPRIHLDGDTLQLEGGIEPSAADELEERGYRVVRWDGRNLYFGGASAVAVRDDGSLEAAGDPRRGGAGLVVA